MLAPKKEEPAKKREVQKTPDLRKNLNLSVTEQRRNLPFNEAFWYTVHKNHDEGFVVTIGKHDDDLDIGRVYGDDDTAEVVYIRAVDKLRSDLKPPAETKTAAPKHDIQAELDSMSNDDIYSMLGVEKPEEAKPSPAPRQEGGCPKPGSGPGGHGGPG